MIQRKSRRIFTERELYKFCLGEICGTSLEEEEGVNSNWADFVCEELEEKYDNLSEAGQNAFDKQLRKVAKKFKDDFDNLPQELRYEEDYEEFKYEQERLMYKIVNELSEFLTKQRTC